MISESGTYLRWIHYGEPRPSLRTVFLSSFKRTAPFSMHRSAKQHLWIDLNRREEEILNGFHPNTRNEIRRYDGRESRVFRDAQVDELAALFRLTRDARGLGFADESNLQRKPENRICSRLYDKTYGLIAAHLYLPDEENKIVYLDVNASAFREKEEQEVQQLCGRGNRWLFFEDMLFFREKGYAVLDLGRIEAPGQSGEELEGVYRFKRSFGGDEKTLYDYLPFWYPWFRKLKNEY